jgi:PAS domain S-box-containing protein
MEFKFVNEEIERDRNAVLEILREKEHYYKNILDTIPIAVYTCDSKGYISFFNKAAAILWGREPRIGKDLWCGSWKIYNTEGERMMPDSYPMAIALKEGRIVNGPEIVIECPDGKKKYVMPYPQPLFDNEGNITGALNTLTDVTEHRHIQLALKVAEEKKNYLTESNISLQHENKSLEQFAYIASHDLQEPVRKIHVYSDRLKKINSQVLDETSIGYIDKIMLASKRMNSLINEVLNYSKLTSQGDRFLKTDLNEIFKTVIEDLELRIEEKQATIKCSVLPVAEIIPAQLTQLFFNLIDNSLKYNIQQGKTYITITSRLLSNDEVANLDLDIWKNYFEITFEDNGIGFRKEFAKNIFDVFHRLNESGHIQGSGIGLAICKKITAIHNGKISADSTPGIGTVIHVILPFQQL